MTSDTFRSPVLRWAAVPVMAMAFPLATTAGPAVTAGYVAVTGSGT
jgi:hypothetical protein